MSNAVNNPESGTKLRYLDFKIDLKMNDIQVYDNIDEMSRLRERMLEHVPSTTIANFEEQFAEVFVRKSLEYKKSR